MVFIWKERVTTREEAIELLEDLYGAIEDNHGRDYDEAFRMAIEALKKEIERHEMVIRASERYLGIVRCKDCKNLNNGWCDVYLQPRMETDFCNHGERLCNHNWRKGGDLE